MDNILEKYRTTLVKQYDIFDSTIFSNTASHKAKILAMLQDPGRSGAEDTNVFFNFTNVHLQKNKVCINAYVY